MTMSGAWPREIGDHTVERTVTLDPATGDVVEYRCVDCGAVFESLDVESVEARDCRPVAAKQSRPQTPSTLAGPDRAASRASSD